MSDSKQLDDHQNEFLSILPPDGSTIGNASVRDTLKSRGWSPARIERVRQQLLDLGLIAPWRGRGGTLYRTGVQEQHFLTVLARLGGTAGNYNMMSELDWNEARYWSVRDSLLEKGSVGRGKGRGGSVYLMPAEEPGPSEPGSPDASSEHAESRAGDVPHYAKESELYELVKKTLGAWAKDSSLHEPKILLTANGKIPGQWRNPDMLVLHLRKFQLLHQKMMEIYTFEVKPRGGWGIGGIHQASAHSRFATHAYAIFHVSSVFKDLAGTERTNLDLCEKEAQRLGVGLIIMTDPADFKTWEELVSPRPNVPDPYLAEEFLNSLDPDAISVIRDFWF